MGRTGRHIDGSFQEAPFSHSLYHIVKVPSARATVFAPLTEIIENAPREKRDLWDRLWMMSDRRSGPIHPLVFSHPETGKPVLCFHRGMTQGFIQDYNMTNQRKLSEQETKEVLSGIHHEFVKNEGEIQYHHKYDSGDFIVSDNLAVGHEGSPNT